eukprot:757746-Hanusia_phi.AAC.1
MLARSIQDVVVGRAEVFEMIVCLGLQTCERSEGRGERRGIRVRKVLTLLLKFSLKVPDSCCMFAGTEYISE